ncbi:MAG: response regulator [Nitrospinota bacterium]|nr:response regulator [Nitrospinota bacterium]
MPEKLHCLPPSKINVREDTDKNDTTIEGMKVLIVDDIKDNIKLLSQALEIEKLNVSFANNGEEALQIVSRAPPDLVLLDIIMPKK